MTSNMDATPSSVGLIDGSSSAPASTGVVTIGSLTIPIVTTDVMNLSSLPAPIAIAQNVGHVPAQTNLPTNVPFQNPGVDVPPIFATTTTLPPQPLFPPHHLGMMPTHAQAKPSIFSGQNFKRWREQVMFYLTTLNLNRYLSDEQPTVQEGENSVWNVAAVEAWKHSDYLSRNYILSYLSDDLFGVYRTLPTSKAVWDALEYKYKTQDAGAKKFIVGRFLDYKMVDGKSVDDQVQELEVIFHEIHAEGMILSEGFQVAAIIEKLPPSWKDFKNYLKHKRKEMTVKELALRLRIEEDNRSAGNSGTYPSLGEAKALPCDVSLKPL